MTNLSELAQPWAMHNPQNNRLPINPNHPFYYRHWPANWEFGSITQGKKSKLNHVFFPSVDIERVVPGVNGVHQIQFDKENWNLWRIELITQGIIEIPHEHFMELSIITAKRYPERLIPSQHLPEVKKKLDSAYAKIKIMETTMNSIIKNGLSYYEGLLNE